MTKEEAEYLASILRFVGHCEAERRALRAIAIEAGIRDLQARLARYRQLDAYKNVLLRCETAAKQVQLDQSAEDLVRLLAELRGTKPLDS